MIDKTLAARLKEAIRGIVESLGLEYVGTELDDARSGSLVRIYIDAPKGVGHEECGNVSRLVGEFMDEAEEAEEPFFSGAYFIEVSSPGLERPLFTLEQYRRFIGRKAAVKTCAKKRFTAEIASCGSGGVEFKMGDGSALVVPIKEIARANLVFVMEKGEKKINNSSKKKTAKNRKPK